MGNISEDAARRGTLNLARELGALDVAPNTFTARADLFNQRGRAWLGRQDLPDDEREAIDRHLRELDRLGGDLAILDREIAEASLDDGAVKRLMTITGVKLTVAASLMAAIGDIHHFSHPGKLVSYSG